MKLLRKKIKIYFGKLRYYNKYQFFEIIKEIILNLLRYLSFNYQTEDDGETFSTLKMMTGIEVEILERIISDLILEGKVYETNCFKYRSY